MTWTTLPVSDDIKNGVTPDGTAFDMVGPSDAPVVSLIHGLGLSRTLWDAFLPELSKHYRVINYDLYGHGNSAPPPATASLSLYANQLAQLLNHLSIERTSVIGFSIGGMINRRFALDYPQHLSCLAILNSPHNRGEQAQAQVEARAATVREQGAMATMDDALKRWFTPDYLASSNSPDLVRQWRNQVDPESYAQAAWVLANGVRELINPTPAINVATLVMTCEHDSGSTPAMSHAIAAEIQNASTIIVPRLQHLGLMEEPKSFSTPIVQFFNEHLA